MEAALPIAPDGYYEPAENALLKLVKIVLTFVPMLGRTVSRPREMIPKSRAYSMRS